MSDKTVSVCPVPPEQQPLNEYQDLKDSWFFSLALQDQKIYTHKIGWMILWGCLLVSPITSVSFPVSKEPLLFIISGLTGGCLLPTAILIRLYLGWMYIQDRLNQDYIIYEESGWYDGQKWGKPPAMLTRDRLIVQYQIKPPLHRLKRTLLIFLGIILMGCFGTFTL